MQKKLLFPIKLKVWLLEKHCPQTLEHTDAFSCEGTKEPRPSRTKRQAALQTQRGLKEELLSLGCQCRESRAGSRCGLPDGLGFHGCQGIYLLPVSPSSLSHGIHVACVSHGGDRRRYRSRAALICSGQERSGQRVPVTDGRRPSCKDSFPEFIPLPYSLGCLPLKLVGDVEKDIFMSVSPSPWDIKQGCECQFVN